MATMTITMPDAHANRVIEALAHRHGWTSASTEPQGKAAKDEVIDFMETVTKHYEAERAGNEAKQEALAQAEADIVLS
jgi:hypothetical protein